MIIISRRLPSSTRNKLHSNFKLGTFVVTPTSTQSTLIMESPQFSLSLSTETPPTQPPSQSSESSGDWSANIFTGESKARAISLLTSDRDNCLLFRTFTKSKAAAVLVPFCYDMEGRPGILYNLRSAHLSSHSCEISFPGGTLEAQDNGDPAVAALRETHEELGIKPEEVDVWTTCRVFPTVTSRMGVVPVIGFIKSGPVDPEKLEINPDEVDHAFIISLDHLCDPRNWSETESKLQIMMNRAGRGFMLPVYENMELVSTRLQGIQLWGLTAFITHLVLTAFVPEKYKRKGSFIKLRLKDKKKDSNNKDDTQSSSSTKSSTSSSESNGTPTSKSKL